MEPNYILGGQAFGSVADRLASVNWDTGALRPYLGEDGKPYVARIVGYKPDGTTVRKPFRIDVANAATLMPAGYWQKWDDAVLEASNIRMQVWDDLAARTPYVIPDGYSITELRTVKASHFGKAIVSMNPIRIGERDRQQIDFDYMPIPIIHADFDNDDRDMRVFERAGLPLDTSQASEAGYNIAQQVEALVLGTGTAYAYGSGAVYGYLNWPSRLTYTMTDPSGAGWTPNDSVKEFLDIKKLLRSKKRYGPFIVYTAPDWDLYLEDDYSDMYGGATLKDRLMRVGGVADIRSLDTLTGFKSIWVQMDPRVARAIIALRMQVVRWEEQGGFLKCQKAMCSYLPQLRADADGNTGVVDVSVA